MANNPTWCLFEAIGDSTIANTDVETSFTPDGIGSATLPADWFEVGRSIEVRAGGYYSTAGNPNLHMAIHLNDIELLETNDAATANNASELEWEVRGRIVCRTTGATGTVMATGWTIYASGLTDGSVAEFQTLTSAVEVDTTGTIAITVNAHWGTAAAGNTITLTTLNISAD